MNITCLVPGLGTRAHYLTRQVGKALHAIFPALGYMPSRGHVYIAVVKLGVVSFTCHLSPPQGAEAGG